MGNRRFFQGSDWKVNFSPPPIAGGFPRADGGCLQVLIREFDLIF
jgi:hypothetical protein